MSSQVCMTSDSLILIQSMVLYIETALKKRHYIRSNMLMTRKTNRILFHVNIGFDFHFSSPLASSSSRYFFEASISNEKKRKSIEIGSIWYRINFIIGLKKKQVFSFSYPRIYGNLKVNFKSEDVSYIFDEPIIVVTPVGVHLLNPKSSLTVFQDVGQGGIKQPNEETIKKSQKFEIFKFSLRLIM
jgi:hypothetical protein